MQQSDYPILYQAADDASLSGQRWYMGLVQADLVLIVVAAALAAVGTLVPKQAGSVFAAITVLVLFASLAAKSVNRQRQDDRDWFDGRAVAESVKTETWRYMMRLAPFDDDTTCDREFAQRLLALSNARPHVHLSVRIAPAHTRQITGEMHRVRTLTFAQRRDLYVQERLDDQAMWYQRKSQFNGRRATQWFVASFGVQAGALTLAVLHIALPLPNIDLVGVLAALAAALTAWTQLKRHDELAISYGLAYQELSTIGNLAGQATTEQELMGAVHSGESAISREHMMWIAKRGEPLSSPYTTQP